jgi:hypothetical protein
MKQMKLRKHVLVALLGIVAGCGILFGALFAALHSPWLLNRLANASGYEVNARTISLSPSLSGSISGLSIKRLRDDSLTLLASNVTAKSSLNMILRGEVDSLVLQNPKVTLRIGKESKGTADLSFLEKLPRIRLLDIQNAEVLLTFEGGQQTARLTNTNLTIKNFSSKTGGSITFQAHFASTTAGETKLAASGEIKGSFQLSGVYPRPYGKGTVELVVDSGKYTSNNRTLSLSGITLAAELAHDQRTETFAITTLRGQSKSLGAIRGTAKAVMRGEMPWDASLSVASIDFAQVLAVLKPFLPEEYRTWTMQGGGAIETQLHGAFASEGPPLTGTVTFSFTQGGFSSPDSTKAAQGVSGKLILKLLYAAPDQKLAFNIRSEQRDGEYLWGTYYSNLTGQQASLAADGTLFLGGDRRFELSGSLDIFRTGDYSFNASGRGDDWDARLEFADVWHGRIVETVLKEYFKGLSPGLASLSITGTSSLEAAIHHEGGATAIAGTYRMTGTALNAPDMQLAVQEIAADLPFNLVYPPSGKKTPLSSRLGSIRFQAIQRKRLTIDSLRVPLLVAGNMLEVPEPVTVPVFGGKIHLYGVEVDDVLFPARYRFGVKVENVDLGRMTRRLTGVEYPGTINADLGVMRYENNRITSEGKAVVNVFGGEIEATRFFGENLGSPSRKFGGDIAFRNIDLEELTRKIPIGKMTGKVRGSVRNLVMEYGEPASFTLVVESVEARGVEQWISMDAIQSISILGTGMGNPLNRGIAQFFKEHPYSKIGFRCVLKNDQFSVNGTIHDGGKEFLVRRGFLRGLDVVNQNPHNVISFRDMEQRIKRIYRTSQAESDGIKVE